MDLPNKQVSGVPRESDQVSAEWHGAWLMAHGAGLTFGSIVYQVLNLAPCALCLAP